MIKYIADTPCNAVWVKDIIFNMTTVIEPRPDVGSKVEKKQREFAVFPKIPEDALF